jgi:hypothetical protein
MEDVQKDVQEQLTGMHCDAIEKVVSQLHVPGCPNTNPAVSSFGGVSVTSQLYPIKYKGIFGVPKQGQTLHM